MDRLCNKCGLAAGNLCAGCRQVYYCSSSHQREDWPYHKAYCLMSRSTGKPLLNEAPPKDQCVGTFRWMDQELPLLPAFPPSLPPLTDWNSYLKVRVPDMETVTPQFIDALSYSVSLIYCLQSTGLSLTATVQNVIIAGASERAEERLVLGTNYFQDLARFHPRVSRWMVYLVGPEISPANHSHTSRLSPNMQVECYRGTLGELLTEHYGEFTPDNTVVIGFNPGFGSGFLQLMASWVSDLVTLMNLGLVVFFTCANDYGDLRGETLVLSEVVGPKYVLTPRQNPVCAMTTLHPPGGRETAWTRSSSFLYGIQGYREGATGPIIPRKDKSLLNQTLQRICASLQSS